MGIDRKILSEIERYHFINNYINEQVEPVEPTAPAPPAPDMGDQPSDMGNTTIDSTPEKVDVNVDAEVEKIGDEGESQEGNNTEEIDVTDIIKSQENIEKKQEEYFDSLFSQVSSLEQKLSQMDAVLDRLNSLESKIEKYREKTPEEKLELRTYDSYPFNQKLSDFFEDKKEEMEKTGKHDYVLTSDQVTDANDKEMKDSFQPHYNPEY
jgi:vacuolar-type H+-ATPase subunit I/STV1